MSDLDQRLTATLHARAGAPADPAPIVDRARRQGRRLRIRRRGLLGLGAAAIAAAIFLVPAVHPVPPRPHGVLPPAAPAWPGAAARPGLVGTDPWTLHFAADDLVAGAAHARWTAGSGMESVEYWGPAGQGRLVLTPDEDRLASIKQALTSTSSPEFVEREVPARVGGRDATVWYQPNEPGDDLWFVRWQPVDGLWARLEVYATGQAEAVAAAERVRFDSARRCAVPFRLTTLPPETEVVSCSVALGATGDFFTEGALVVGDEQRWMTVRAQRTEGGGSEKVEVQSGVVRKFVRPVVVEAFLQGLGYGYAEADARTILDGYDQVDHLDDVTRW